MFRRRPRRPGRPVSRAVNRLNQAHHLMNEGHYLQAANIFVTLAEGAIRRRIPRAPFLFIQAGRAFLSGGKQAQGVKNIKRGLKLLADARRWGELYRVGNRLVDELNEKRLNEESNQLAEWLTAVLPENSEQVANVKAEMKKRHPLLPTNCPQCGGIINSKEVTWIDDYTAECLFCGSAVRAEN